MKITKNQLKKIIMKGLTEASRSDKVNKQLDQMAREQPVSSYEGFHGMPQPDSEEVQEAAVAALNGMNTSHEAVIAFANAIRETEKYKELLAVIAGNDGDIDSQRTRETAAKACAIALQSGINLGTLFIRALKVRKGPEGHPGYDDDGYSRDPKERAAQLKAEYEREDAEYEKRMAAKAAGIKNEGNKMKITTKQIKEMIMEEMEDFYQQKKTDDNPPSDQGDNKMSPEELVDELHQKLTDLHNEADDAEKSKFGDLLDLINLHSV